MTRSIPLKQWVAETMAKDGLSRSGVFMRMYRGKYPWVSFGRKNKRVVWVNPEASLDWLGLGAINDPLNSRP